MQLHRTALFLNFATFDSDVGHAAIIPTGSYIVLDFGLQPADSGGGRTEIPGRPHSILVDSGSGQKLAVVAVDVHVGRVNVVNHAGIDVRPETEAVDKAVLARSQPDPRTKRPDATGGAARDFTVH